MNKHTSLTQAKATELGGAIADLATLAEKSIVEKDDAAKKRALTSYIQDTLMAHCDELLSCWFVVEREYRPLLQTQATLMGNCFAILQRRQQMEQAAQASTPAEKVGESMEQNAGGTVAPGNVIPLNPTTTSPLMP